MSEPPSTKVLFIGGWDRSGSTIVSNLIGEHASVFSAGEVNNLWERGGVLDRPCGCGVAFSACPVWTTVLDAAFGGLDETAARRLWEESRSIRTIDLVARRLPGGASVAAERISSHAAPVAAVLHAIARTQGAELVVDASKNPSHGAVLAAAPGIELYVLHLVRDVRGVTFSTTRHRRYDTDEAAPVHMDRHPVARSAAIWGVWNTLLETRIPRQVSYRRVRYEDVMAAPAPFVDQVLRWCGVDPGPSPFVDDHHVRLGVNHNVAGNPSRFRSGVVELALDDEWKRAMPRWQQGAIAAALSPLLAHYGYLRRTR
ncbi:MAG: hypothetical protein KDB21_07070 [Acidimicrobiales bacterium]|nr:hypothetical protein [Acidimicrobiales bacterium]